MTTVSLHDIAWASPLWPSLPTDGSREPARPPLAACPWLLRALTQRHEVGLVHVSHRLNDLIGLVVSQDNSCRHCYGATRAMLRLFGHSEERIRVLESELHRVELPETERRALEYARLVSRASPRAGAAETKALRDAGWSEAGIAEIITCASCCVFGNRIATLSALTPDPVEQLAARWYAPLASLAMRWSSRRKRKPARPVAAPPEAKLGPLGPLFQRLDGLPVAGYLSETLSAALASPILPKRTKLMVFAVIARSLGCPVCHGALEPLLQAESVEQAVLEDVLRRLSSSALSPLEARLIPLARETVRYQQPAPLQEKLRELKTTMSDAELLEFVGIAALANTFARLTVVLGLS
jgi:AhpD family alkylhydroperoxidase